MSRTDRYAGAVAASVALAALGLVVGRDALVVSATVPLAYVAYGSMTGVALEPGDVVVERSIARTGAFPGDRLEVELTVRNESDGPLADVRVIDGVPDALPVVDGTPRGAVALRPGESATVEYTVVANRGEHPFPPATVRARSLAGTDVETLEVDPDGDATVVCTPYLEGLPLGTETTQFAGRVQTDTGGPGVEFHSTREYRHGDPVSRIDWRRLARGGDLSTVEFRQHRAARVVLVVDARNVCHVAPGRGVPTGAAMSAFGAARALSLLLSDGHQVGAAAFGVGDAPGIGPEWVEPGRGEELEMRVRDLLETAATGPGDVGGEVVAPTVDGSGDDGPMKGPTVQDPGEGEAGSLPTGVSGTDDGTPAPDGGTDDVEVLRERLPPDAQVLFFTPTVDTFPREVVQELRAFGHGVTVLSPDVTHENTPGGKLRTVERELMLEEIRNDGVSTIDWSRDRPLALVLEDALREVVA